MLGRELGARKSRWQDWAEDTLTGSVGMTEALGAPMGSSGAGGLPSCLQLEAKGWTCVFLSQPMVGSWLPFQGHYLRTFSVSQQQPGMGTLALKSEIWLSTVGPLPCPKESNQPFKREINKIRSTRFPVVW